MPFTRRAIVRSFAALSAIGGAPHWLPMGLAHAAQDGPVTMVVPFPPGGTTDLLGRIFAQELGAQLQRTVIVENRPGAGGGIGAGHVAKSKPDGNLMLMATVGTQSINPTLYPSLGYASNSFAPISRVGNVSNVLVIDKRLPIKTVSELIRYGKEHPGKLSFGSAGNGSSMHLTGEMFKSRSGVVMDHVPYRGSGPAMNDLIAGHISMIFENLPTALPHIAAGKVRALAVTSAQRAQAFPDLPTISESGLQNFNATSWFGLLLPAGGDAAQVQRIHALLQQITASPAVQKKLQALGVEPTTDASPAAFQTLIDADMRKWAAVIREANVKLD